jgi:hypothetical protein
MSKIKKPIENYNNIKISSIKLRSTAFSSNSNTLHSNKQSIIQPAAATSEIHTTTTTNSTCESSASCTKAKKFIFKSKGSSSTTQNENVNKKTSTNYKKAETPLLLPKTTTTITSTTTTTTKFKLKRLKSDLNSSNSSNNDDNLSGDELVGVKTTTDTKLPSPPTVKSQEKISNSTTRKIFKKIKNLQQDDYTKCDVGFEEDEGDLFSEIPIKKNLLNKKSHDFDEFDHLKTQKVLKSEQKQPKNSLSPQSNSADAPQKLSPTTSLKANISLPPSPPSSTTSNHNDQQQQKPQNNNKFNVIKHNLNDLDDDLDEINDEPTKKFKLFHSNPKKEPTLITIVATETSNISTVIKQNKIFSSKTTRANNFKLTFDQDEEKTPTKSAEINKDFGEKTKSDQKDLENSKKRKEALENDDDMVNLRSTRKAYECEQLGEEQAFLDDFYYLLEGLSSTKYPNRLSDRCLSAIKLAEECLSTSFRMNLRSLSCYERIFDSLNDCAKYKSLSLCTSLILYILTQDKLAMDLNKFTFNLIISILNSNDNDESLSDELLEDDANFSYLSDLIFNKKRLSVASSSSLSGSPTLSSCNLNSEENDDLIFSKVYSKCKRIYENLPSNKNLSNSASNYELNFNKKLMALDCLLNININMKKNLLLNGGHNNDDYFRHELRRMNVLDKLMLRLKLLHEIMEKLDSKNETNNNSEIIFYLINRFRHCINFLETMTQHNHQLLNSNNSIEYNNSKKMQLAIKDSENDENFRSEKEPVHILNQNYLIDYGKNFLINIFKK